MKVVAIGIASVAVAGAVTAVTVFLLRQEKTAEPAITLQLPVQIAHPDPLQFEPVETEEYEQAAAFGLSHVLFEKSPGGAVGAARRTARFRAMVDKATSGTDIDPDLVEAIVMLESGGRQDVIAGDDPANAAGLTQIVAGTATDFLGMNVDLEANTGDSLVFWTRRSIAATTPKLRVSAPSADKRTRASIPSRHSRARCAI